ncbi:MAG: glycosyltransferase, partial [Planctomycetota bacterium JB042]
MRIAHAVHGHPPELIGGTELYVARLAHAQRAAGHDARVFAGSVEWREEFEVEDETVDGVPVRRVHRNDLYFDRWDKTYQPFVSDAWDRFLAEVRPDVVHVHHWIRLTSDLVAGAARAGVPAVVTAHDLFPTCPRVFRLKDDAGDVAC